jgi:hypothetical protein
MDEQFWKTVREKRQETYRSSRTGALNIALLFGTAAIALALILTPMLASHDDRNKIASVKQDFDMLTTGSISKPQPSTTTTTDADGKRYTIRRSVIQETPGSVCIVQGYSGGSDC